MMDVVLVAALGPHSNHHLVRRNLEHFEGWRCVALRWHADAPTIPGCEDVLRPGYGWASLINASLPTVDRSSPRRIFLLLDDVRLKTFDVGELTEFTVRHRLGYASPAVKGATHPFMSHRTPAPFIEFYATLFRADAWRCLSSLFHDSYLHDATGALGYGYDLCMTVACRQHRWGLLRSQSAVHLDARPGRRLSLRDRAHVETADAQLRTMLTRCGCPRCAHGSPFDEFFRAHARPHA